MKTGIEMTCSRAFACGENMVSVPIGAQPYARKICSTIQEAREFVEYCKANYDGFSVWPSVRHTRKPRGFDKVEHTLRFDKV